MGSNVTMQNCIMSYTNKDRTKRQMTNLNNYLNEPRMECTLKIKGEII
jgi:hypothetical protein